MSLSDRSEVVRNPDIKNCVILPIAPDSCAYWRDINGIWWVKQASWFDSKRLTEYLRVRLDKITRVDKGLADRCEACRDSGWVPDEYNTLKACSMCRTGQLVSNAFSAGRKEEREEIVVRLRWIEDFIFPWASEAADYIEEMR